MVRAGCHANLPEHLPQVVIDGGGAEEQLRGYVPVAVPPADEPGDLRLLRREPGFSPAGPLPGAFPGGQQLDAGPFGEGPAPIEVNMSCAVRSCSRASRRRRSHSP
jgi:hypothetical protein